MPSASKLPTYAVPLAAVAVAFIIFSSISSRQPNITDVSVPEARQLIDAGAVVVDVRDRSVSGSSHINGALLIPLESLAGRLSEVAADRSTPVVVYCNEGTNRGPRGTALLNEAGYTQAVNLKTGIEGWRAANLPTAAVK